MTAVLDLVIVNAPLVTLGITVGVFNCRVLDEVVDCGDVGADGGGMAVFGTPWTAMNCIPKIPTSLKTVAVWTMPGARFAVENIQVIELGIALFVADAR